MFPRNGRRRDFGDDPVSQWPPRLAAAARGVGFPRRRVNWEFREVPRTTNSKETCPKRQNRQVSDAEARDLFKYRRDVGGFEGWVKARLGWSQAHAHRLIAIHEDLGGKANQLACLSRSALFQLAAPSETPEVRDATSAAVETATRP